MSYMALARKWRPHTFAEMVGQEHVLRALVNALDQDRLHHAFLFSGTRGVGKTTLGRILARCLNCEQGVSSAPCGSCSACREIDEGRFVDLIEVDAASRTKVDDTRELLDNIQYAPSRGRFKVYLIDEVHMLSNHSFNALLKSLEEPPPHVKFVLATTDPQKVPVTILSRCLQFSLKRLSRPLIQGQLERITGSEGIPADPVGLVQIASAADGSMRDALSLLDQAISFGGGAVTGADVTSMLGTIDRGDTSALLRALADGDGEALMQAAARLGEQAPDYTAVLDSLASTLQRVALAQIVPRATGDADLDAERIAELAGVLEPEDVQLYYEIALLGKRNLPLAPDPHGGLEMTLLRMLAFRPVGTVDGPAASPDASVAPPRPADDPSPGRQGSAAGVRRGESAARRGRVPAGPGRAETAPPAESAAPGAARGDAQPAEAGSATETGGGPRSDWPAMVAGLELGGIARELAHNCTVAAREGNVLRLALDPAHSQMHTSAAAQRLQKAVQRFLGEPGLRVRIEIGAPGANTPAQREADHRARRQQEAVRAVETDPNVKALRDRFGAELFTDSIKPVD